MNAIRVGFFLMLCTACDVWADTDTRTQFPNVSDNDKIQYDIKSTTPPEYASPRHSEPLISINTDNPLDMNWRAELMFNDPEHRTTQMPVPFLQRHKINNLEIKLRVVDVHF